MNAIAAEFLKLRRSPVIPATFVAFSLAPLMGGVFMLIMQDPTAMERAGALQAKAEAMGISADWRAFLMVMDQAMGIGGILVFGFVASWIFGREYSDGTAKDLLALPVGRTRILNAKFLIYALWCMSIAVAAMLIALIIGSIMGLPAPGSFSFMSAIARYLFTAMLVILLGTPVAFFAMWGSGYLAPVGFVALGLVFAQVIAAAGFGTYFPWSVPALLSGADGAAGGEVNAMSFLILVLASVAGYMATIWYWRSVDQVR